MGQPQLSGLLIKNSITLPHHCFQLCSTEVQINIFDELDSKHMKCASLGIMLSLSSSF